MNFLRGFFLNNLELKGISLFLAFLLWLQIAGQPKVQREISIPVEFINMPEQLEISNDYPRQVNVLISSEQSTASLDLRNLSAMVDLSQIEAGSHMIPLTPQNIKNVPVGVEILQITPPRLQLHLERTQRKIVKVDTEILGQPAQGYQVREVRLMPGEVLITGPESRVGSISAVETEPINIEGRSGTLTRRVFLDLPDPRVRIEDVTYVTAVVTIEEKRREVRLRRVPLEVAPGHPAASFSPRSIEVLGSVPVSYQGRVDGSGFRAVVKTEALPPGPTPYELVPEIVVPEEYREVFRVKSISPPLVKVTRTG